MTIHSSYQHNYYKDVLRVRNRDDDAMNVFVVFYSVASTLPTGSVVRIFIYGDGTRVADIDATDPARNVPIRIGVLGAGKVWQIDVYVYVPEDAEMTGRQYTASARLVFTPSGEVPPVNPSGGRALLARVSRGALTFADFESYPVSGWASLGGEWAVAPGGGFRGNALRGRDTDGGLGGASIYYWETRVDGYSSLWASVRVRAEAATADADGYKGLALLSGDKNMMYQVWIRDGEAGVSKWLGNRWVVRGRVNVTGYDPARWYTLVVRYLDRGTAVDFELWVYDGASQVAYLSVSHLPR